MAFSFLPGEYSQSHDSSLTSTACKFLFSALYRLHHTAGTLGHLLLLVPLDACVFIFMVSV